MESEQPMQFNEVCLVASLRNSMHSSLGKHQQARNCPR